MLAGWANKWGWFAAGPAVATGRVLPKLSACFWLCLLAVSLALVPARAEEDEQVLNVGVLTAPAPYYDYSDTTGEPIGFALDLWRAISKSAGISYRFVFFDTMSDLLAAAEKRTIDIVPLLAMDKNAARLFDFTAPVQASPVSVFTLRDGSDINGPVNLIGHRVAVVEGHVGQELMRSYRGELSISHDNLDDAHDRCGDSPGSHHVATRAAPRR